MRATLVGAFLLFLFLAARFSVVISGAQTSQPRAADTQVARGRYLVEEVAKCAECHTPRDSNFELDRSRWLQGASIWIQPVHPVANWAQFAPTLAGLPSMSDAQVERVLEKGQGANGGTIEPPMHIYHMTHADAQAIIAYLRSLPTATSR
jgi:mono/diheme cytochrome c family protein